MTKKKKKPIPVYITDNPETPKETKHTNFIAWFSAIVFGLLGVYYGYGFGGLGGVILGGVIGMVVGGFLYVVVKIFIEESLPRLILIALVVGFLFVVVKTWGWLS